MAVCQEVSSPTLLRFLVISSVAVVILCPLQQACPRFLYITRLRYKECHPLISDAHRITVEIFSVKMYSC